MKSRINTERIQQALVELTKLTPEQVQKLSQQESLVELRFKRLENLKKSNWDIRPTHTQLGPQRGQTGPHPPERGDLETPDSADVEEVDMEGSGIDWQIYGHIPIVGFKKAERNYQKQINNVLQEFRSKVRNTQQNKDSQAQLMGQQKFYRPKIREPKNPRSMLQASTQSQSQPQSQNTSRENWLDSYPASAYKVTGLQKFKQNPISQILPHSNFGIVTDGHVFDNGSRNNAPHTGSTQVDQTDLKNHGQEFLQAQKGFVPSSSSDINNSSLFSGTLKAPEIPPPQPITPKSSLFSESNPLFRVNTTANPFLPSTASNQAAQESGNPFASLFNNNPNNSTTPLPSIFEKTSNMKQPEPVPVPSAADIKGGLFSSGNPWAEMGGTDGKDNKFNLFDNKKVVNIPVMQPTKPQIPQIPQPQTNISTPQQKPSAPIPLVPSVPQQQPQQQQQQQLQSNFNIFNNTNLKPTVTLPVFKGDHPFGNNTNNTSFMNFTASSSHNADSGLFKNVTTTVPAASGTLFTSGNAGFALNPVTSTNTTPSAKPNLFSNPITPTLQPEKPAQKKQPVYQSGSLFTNSFKPSEPTLFPKPLPPRQAQQKPQPKGQVQPPIEPAQQGKKNIFDKQAIIPNAFNQRSAPIPLSSNIFSHPTSTHEPTKPSLFGNPSQEPKKMDFFNLIKPVQQGKEDKEEVRKKPSQLFGEFAKSKPENMFSKDPGSGLGFAKKDNEGGIFGSLNPAGGLFGNLPSNTGGGIFGSLKPSQSMFSNLPSNQQNPLFKKKEPTGIFTTTGPLFGQKEPKQDEDEQQGGEEEDEDQVIEHKQQIDPSKSTGDYKYEQSQVKYRETVPKFKRGTQNIVQNIILSIQKFTGTDNHTLCVRLSNKCPYFSGTVIPGTTQIAKINQNSFKNLSVKKIACNDQNGKLVLELLKIQFKDQGQGAGFYAKFSDVCKKNK